MGRSYSPNSTREHLKGRRMSSACFPPSLLHIAESSTEQRLCVRDGRKTGKKERKATRREASFGSKLISILSYSLVFVNGLNILPIVLQSLVLTVPFSGLSSQFLPHDSITFASSASYLTQAVIPPP